MEEWNGSAADALDSLSYYTLPFFLTVRREIEIIWTNKLLSSSPVGEASDTAKPYQSYVKQRSCGDCEHPL